MKLDDIMEAPLTGPTKFALHSIPGFGKTTLAAEFPAPVFEAPENGFPRDLPYKPRVFPRPDRWEAFFEHVEFLTFEKHPFLTYVGDTVDWMEPFIHRYVCERDSGRKTELNKSGHKLVSIEDYGYGRGYTAAEEEFRRFINALDLMQAKRGIHVVFLMHTQVKNFKNPTGPDYDQYIPKVNKGIAAIISEWVENLFFGHYDIDAAKLTGEAKAKGVYSGKRLLGTRATAAYDAKNRIDLKGVVELDDPRELIPYLLGQRVSQRQWDSAPAKNGPANETVPYREPEQRKQPEPPREPERKAPVDPREERMVRNFEQDAKRNFEPAPTGDGVPAHHESRKADEDRRRDEAFEEQRKRNAAQAERDERDRQERERQGWKEPKHPSEVKQEAPPTKEQKNADTNDRIARLAKLIERAGKERGDDYRKKVEKWTKGAKGDPNKIDAIIEDVENTLNAAAPAA